MSTDVSNTIDNVDELDRVITHIFLDNQDIQSLRQWERLKKVIRELPKLRKELNELQEVTRKLGEPPLQHAIYLGPSPGGERDIIIGLGSTRLEVQLAKELEAQVKALSPGQIVVLNKEQNVVAIRDEYTCGETAEVVNIIKPEGEAKVLEIIAGQPEHPTQLRVRWREEEEIEVACSEELTRLGTRPGNFVQIVQVEEHQKLAMPQARPRLHVKAGGSEGTVVEISESLNNQEVQIGDIVRIEPGLRLAFEKLPTYETGELTLEEVPDVTYDDIGGLEEQIGQIYDAIELPYLYRERFEEYQLTRPKGILLYGPPGCGKTMIAKAVANSLTQSIRSHLPNLEQYLVLFDQLQRNPGDAQIVAECNRLIPQRDGEPSDTSIQKRFAKFLRGYDIDVEELGKELAKIRSLLAKKDGVRSFFLNVKGPELLDKYVGETEHRIRKIFEEARRHATYYTPVIIFFDEMEAMFRTRGSGRSSDVETTIVPQFLSEIDGVESTSNLIVIGASNRQDMIDPAILRPKRLDVKIKVDRPSRKAAQDIFAMYLLPTLPLSAEGLILPGAKDSLGEVVFRTAYQRVVDPRQRMKATQDVNVAEIKDFRELLPEGCDFRLALSLQPSDLNRISNQSKAIVREIIARESEESQLKIRLRRFKANLEVGKMVEYLQQLHKRYTRDAVVKQAIDEFINLEWLAETIILQAIAKLYSSSNVISALTSNGNTTFPLKDFMSGAIIANIVDRAKRQAIKRVVIDQNLDRQGISLNDLHEAIKQEFEENKDQLVQHKLYGELGRVGEDIQFVQLLMETGENDPWSEEKLQLYKTTSR